MSFNTVCENFPAILGATALFGACAVISKVGNNRYHGDYGLMISDIGRTIAYYTVQRPQELLLERVKDISTFAP